MSSTIRVEVDTKTYVRFVVVVSVFVAIVFLLSKLLPVLLVLAISFFLAIALNKPVHALSRHLPGKSRVLAIALVYVLFVTLLVLFFSIIVPPAIKQTTAFVTSLPQFIAQLSQNGGVTANIIHRYHLQSEVNAFVSGIQQQVGSFAQGIGTNVVAGVSTVLLGLITMIAILVLTFLMLIEGPKWQQELWKTYTSPTLLKRHQQLADKMYHVITGYVNGQVLVASIAAVLAGLILFILTRFFAVPLGIVLPSALIILCFELIPVVGPTIGGLIVLTVLSFNDLGAALVYLVYFVIYLQIEANIVQPAVQSRTVDISALTVFVAVITGIILLGIPGGILAIPVAGCIRILVLDFIEERHSERLRRQHISESS